MDHGKARVDTSALMSPRAETPLLSHVLTCDTFSGPALSPSPNIVQIVHVPLTCPVPVTKMCHTLYVPAFLLPTLSQGSPLPVSVLIRQPTCNHSAPLQGSPLLPPITVQFRLAYVPSCSVLIQDPSPSSSLLCISCPLTAQPHQFATAPPITFLPQLPHS